MKKYLSEKLKIREDNLKYDFLPPMVEIIERPSNKLGIIIMFLIIALIVSSIIWAAMSRIDIAVTATGTLEPKGGVITLSSMVNSKVSEILVTNNEAVEKGDPVVKLDSTETELSLSEIKSQLETMKVQDEVYRAIYNQLASEGSKKNLDIDTEKYGENKALADQIIQENKIYMSKLEKITDKGERLAAEEQHILEVLNRLAELSTDIKSAETKIKSLEHNLSLYTLNAPESGKINGIEKLNVGDSVSQGSSLGYLVPSGKDYIFSAYVADENIEQICTGREVVIKLAALNSTQYKNLSGKIVSISDAAAVLENPGKAYVVEIKIDSLPETVRAGMDGACDIIVGSRTVLEYFMEPFIKGFEGSLKEQ